MRSIHRNIDSQNSISTELEVRGWYDIYKVTISMDSTKSKAYIRYIIYKLTKLKIDIRLLDFTLWFSRIKHSIAGQSNLYDA